MILVAALMALPLVSGAAKKPLKLSQENVDKVLNELTLEEKVHLIIGNPGPHRPGIAGSTYPVERLGVPQVILADGPAGIRIKPEGEEIFWCTAFPTGVHLASTWDTEAAYEVGEAIGEEMLSYGVGVILGPGINIHRNPLNGRNFEYFSEDPVITGKVTANYVKGVQSKGLGTSVKHFAVNSQEMNRLNVDHRVSERAVREIYLKGFETAVKEADPWTVMTSYNRVNGTLTCETPDLINGILRDEWGFDNLVMSDWSAGIDNAAMILAGNDIIEPWNKGRFEKLMEAVENGTLPMAAVDAAARRVLELDAKYLATTAGTTPDKKPDLAAHAATARRIAAEGMVLLKNDGVLPLTPGPVSLKGTSGKGWKYVGGGAAYVYAEHPVTLEEGLAAAGFTADDNAQTVIWTLSRWSVEGRDRILFNDFNLSIKEQKELEALSAECRRDGKKLVVVLNVCGVVETASWRDLADAILLTWMPGQEGGNAAADVLCGKANPSGRLPVTFPMHYRDVPSQNFPLVPNPKDENYSFYRHDSVPHYDIPTIDYVDHTEGIYVGYRHYCTNGVKSAYPFGFGLSYTSFSRDALKVAPCEGGWKVSCRVTNTGSAAGRDVVQLYVSAPQQGASLDKPERELKGFAKSALLAPGESQVVEMVVSAEDLASFVEARNAWVTDAGSYIFRIADNAEDAGITATVSVDKKIVRPCAYTLAPEGRLFID